MLRILLLAALAYLAVCTGMYVFQRRLMYHGGSQRPVAPEGVAERTLHTRDGLDLLAWYLAPAPGRPVVLLLHGNAGNLNHRIPRLAPLAARGWGALFVEYRGFGGNPGAPSEEGLHLDALAGYEALAGLGIPADRIVIWGESLGTAVASRLATEKPAAALVLESPFTSMLDMGRRIYPYLPVGLLLKDRFDTLARIGGIRMPLLVVNGALDTLVPPAMGTRLLEASGAAAKALRTLPRSGHNEMVEEGVMQVGIDFLARRFGEG
jgi:fermentation-respiration switch protein FrsA (DUF1100 family)